MRSKTSALGVKKIFVTITLAIFTLIQANASFLYQEIDPICSASWKTHTSFPGEISDTSAWSVPKAYDGECEKVPVLKVAEKKIINARVIKMLQNKNMIASQDGSWYTLTSKGKKFVQDNFFPAVAKYIGKEIKKSKPRLKNISILNQAVSIIGYDYYIDAEVRWDDYVGLSVEDAQALAQKNNTTLRITKLDWEFMAVTMDYRPGRINAEVENNIVTHYSVE